MCLLIVLHDVDPRFPVVVASNRDEFRARKGAPPGLFVGEERRILSPRDRRAGGTWIGVNDHGMFAGLTNYAGVPERPDAPSRGELPHLALDAPSVADAASCIEERIAATPHSGFQLVITDGPTAVVFAYDGRELTRTDRSGPGSLIISNEHRLDTLRIPGLEAATEPDLEIDARLDALAPLLLDEGERSGHRILKRGEEYGTVSSSILAIQPGPPPELVWRFSSGPPDEAEYRNYGNLARRLLDR